MKALCTGSFNPLTAGHIDVVKRAAALFDGVVVGVLINEEKCNASTLQAREQGVVAALAEIGASNVEVSSSTGLAVELMHTTDCAYLVRGIRNFADYAYEREMSEYNQNLGATTLYLLSSPDLKMISSTLIRG